ncbi:hypothetical protein NB696_002984 [Xanthomonas sacchari]|nr:hypothetical protein [Xanthomonas sacchari]MCW0446112.1 hypothetical protein [Xanthomonas sacchari]MCW0464628.1 hypothetical protein [Xanthomonas sacchari]
MSHAQQRTLRQIEDMVETFVDTELQAVTRTGIVYTDGVPQRPRNLHVADNPLYDLTIDDAEARPQRGMPGDDVLNRTPCCTIVEHVTKLAHVNQVVESALGGDLAMQPYPSLLRRHGDAVFTSCLGYPPREHRLRIF